MIEVSVQPSRIVVGRPTRLAIRFVNTSQGRYSKIIFRLELPSGISLAEGRSGVEIPSIPAGETRVHELTVEASRSGEFELTSGTFSYRDQYGVPQYRGDFRWTLSVAAGESARLSAPRAVPSLAVRLEGDAVSELPVGTWSEIKILVRNTADVPVGGVTVDVSGPLRTNTRRGQVSQLLPGQAARFTFSVIADEAGRVPFGARTTFTYPDGLGSVRQATQDDGFHVVAGRAGPVATAAEQAATAAETVARVETILFLGASPAELPPIRPDLELRKISREMRIDRNRDQFRLEYCAAAQLTDISRALVEYKPQVVHFSGHGDGRGGVYLEDDEGRAKPATAGGLAQTLGWSSSTIRCVVVNACYSLPLAEAVSQYIGYAVGMRAEIGDGAAILFSVGFYQALLGGEEVPKAFELARSLLRTNEETEPEYQTPVLYAPGLR